MKRFNLAWLLAVSLLLAATRADDTSVTDEALLEDLGAELLEPVTENPKSILDEQLLDQLGEDLGQAGASQDDSLARAIEHMQIAQKLLKRSDRPSGASAAQGDALTNLDSLIAELTERKGKCSGGNCAKPGKPGEKKPNNSKKAGKSPAKSAPTGTNSDGDLSTDLAVASELVKDLWGQLPERQREQILQPLSEEFLPKYAAEIEAYFRDLAEPKRTELP